jgi:hypothetical protein
VARFRVVATGRYREPVDPEHGARVVDALRSYLYEATSVRDPLTGAFEFVLPVDAATENEALALGRVVTTSALFDGGFSIQTSTIDDVSVRTLH